GDRLAARHGLRAGLAGKQLFEDAAVEIRFLALWRVDREATGRGGKLGVADVGFGVGFEPVDPAVADTVAELLFLAPEDFVGQVAFERLAQYRLLDTQTATRSPPDHLGAGVHALGDVQELAVENRHAGLDAPGHHRFVRTQAVVVV